MHQSCWDLDNPSSTITSSFRAAVGLISRHAISVNRRPIDIHARKSVLANGRYDTRKSPTVVRLSLTFPRLHRTFDRPEANPPRVTRLGKL